MISFKGIGRDRMRRINDLLRSLPPTTVNSGSHTIMISCGDKHRGYDSFVLDDSNNRSFGLAGTAPYAKGIGRTIVGISSLPNLDPIKHLMDQYNLKGD